MQDPQDGTKKPEGPKKPQKTGELDASKSTDKKPTVPSKTPTGSNISSSKKMEGLRSPRALPSNMSQFQEKEEPLVEEPSNSQSSSDQNPNREEHHEPSWAMFEKVKELGVGSFGVVYLVKCMQNSVIRTDAANLFQASTPAGSASATKVLAKNARKGSNFGAATAAAPVRDLTAQNGGVVTRSIAA